MQSASNSPPYMGWKRANWYSHFILSICVFPQIARCDDEGAAPRFRFTHITDYDEWQEDFRKELVDCLAIPRQRPKFTNSETVLEEETSDYSIYRVSFQTEPNQVAYGYLLKPNRAKKPLPVMICLQGHSQDGMKVSIGRASVKGGRDFALQAVERGYAALALEQRGFGVHANESCDFAAKKANLIGKPLTGRRVLDVMYAIDFVERQADLDSERIGCMGNSLGGTVTFYAAAVDPRIETAIVSCSFCTFEGSWLKHPHCSCGYVPGLAVLGDMSDIGGLIAPRKLLIVAGEQDHLADIGAVREAYAHTRMIFAKANAESHAQLVVGPDGHQFYPDLAWPEIEGFDRTAHPSAKN